MMPGTLLMLRDVSLGYDDRVVLAHLSFAVECGECLALVGPNGAGKTTLLRGILGLIPVLAGRITYGFDRATSPPAPPSAPPPDRTNAIRSKRAKLLFGRPRAKTYSPTGRFPDRSPLRDGGNIIGTNASTSSGERPRHRDFVFSDRIGGRDFR